MDQILLIKCFDFRYVASNTIKTEIMQYVIHNHNHMEGIMKLHKSLPLHIAIVMEEGILEYTMIYISSNNIEITLFSNIFNDIINNICANIDNKRIKNKTLKISLLNNTIDPYTVAFMTPQQINPSVWASVINKQNNIEDALRNTKVTDLYKCKKCGDRRSTSTQLQTRSADEAATIFVTCLTCYNTFTMN